MFVQTVWWSSFSSVALSVGGLRRTRGQEMWSERPSSVPSRPHGWLGVLLHLQLVSNRDYIQDTGCLLEHPVYLWFLAAHIAALRALFSRCSAVILKPATTTCSRKVKPCLSIPHIFEFYISVTFSIIPIKGSFLECEVQGLRLI